MIFKMVIMAKPITTPTLNDLYSLQKKKQNAKIESRKPATRPSAKSQLMENLLYLSLSKCSPAPFGCTLCY